MIVYSMLMLDGKFYGSSKIICDSCHKEPICLSSNVSRDKLERDTNVALEKSFRTIHDWPHVEHVCRDGCKHRPATMLPVQAVWVAGDESVKLKNVIKTTGPGGTGEGPIEDVEFRIETPTPTDRPDIEYNSALKLKKVLLIDGQNILKRCYFARSREVDNEGNHVGGVRGWVEMVSRVARRYRDRKVIAVWDGGSSPKRLAMLPTYRLRKPDDSDHMVNKQRESAVFIARQLGIVNLQYPNVEADDVIAYLSRHSDSSVTYSNDGDFIQLVREGHTVHRPIPREKGFDCIVSTVTFHKETGYNGSVAFALAKAMSGDTSDGIKGVPRIGEKTSLEIMTATGISGWGKVTDGAIETLRAWNDPRLTKNWGLFLASYQLINLWSDDHLSGRVRAQIDVDLSQEHEAPAVAHDALLLLGYDERLATQIVDSF